MAKKVYEMGILPEPVEIAVAHIYDHAIAGKHGLPDPEDVEQLRDVFNTVVNHTGLPLEQVEGYEIDIRRMMRGLGEYCQGRA